MEYIYKTLQDYFFGPPKINLFLFSYLQKENEHYISRKYEHFEFDYYNEDEIKNKFNASEIWRNCEIKDCLNFYCAFYPKKHDLLIITNSLDNLSTELLEFGIIEV